jgi:pimeloyl-ACP methyl ester carboxylesterase
VDERIVVTKRKPSTTRRWIRRAFFVWAIVSTAWMANSVRTRGVDDSTLASTAAVSVVDGPATLAFVPAAAPGKTGLIFFCGSGIAAPAYAPLLRPIADAGYPVFVIKLPYRFAPLESHRLAALARARGVFATMPGVSQWVVSGHSLGGALAARLAQSRPPSLSALVLIGTTHPRDDDLSSLQIPVTKVYASNDRIAPRERVIANRRLLPAATRWIEINGANHSQFGRYGHQLFDGTASISRDEQEAITRSAILSALGGESSR